MWYRKKKKEKSLLDKMGEKVKKAPDYKKKLDRIFSLYIRLRDSREFNFRYFRCISCGEIKPFDKGDNGHYFSRSKMSTRYNEYNCNIECSSCNRFKSDHLVGYRENLIKKIGQRNFDLLNWESARVKQWSDFELKELIRYYQAVNKKMLEEKG